MTKERFRSKVGGGGAVEQRLSKHACRAKREGDQKPAEAAIAVQERMNGFKLDMDQAGLEQPAECSAFLHE